MSEALDDPVGTAKRPLSSAKYVLVLLFLGNLLNFYDRALPAVVLEQIKADFALDDAQVGVIASAFVLVAGLAGVPLGRLGDRIPRKAVAGWGLVVWSLATAAGGVLSNFWAFFASRVGVGVGESSYSPATSSLISDLYPPNRRSRAIALFTLGFPIGTLLAYFTAGALAEAFDTWRAPFLIAAVPGLVLAVLILRIREPRRGAADPVPTAPLPAAPSLRTTIASLLRTRSMIGLVVAFAGYNFAAYSIGTFLTPVLQRYYGLDLVPAASLSGVVVGVTGLIGLLAGGPLLDRAAARAAGARHWISASVVGLGAVCSLVGFAAGRESLWQLVLFLSLAYLFSIIYLAAYIPVTAEVVAPEQRSTAFGVIVAIGYLIGGAGGPISVGLLSDSLGAGGSADGLRTAMMILVPIAYAVAAAGMLFAARAAAADRAAVTSRQVIA